MHIRNLLKTIFFISSLSLLSNNLLAQSGSQIGIAEQQRVRDGAEALKKINEEARKRCSDPEYFLYYQKTACIAREITKEQLEDQSRITPSEKIVFAKVKQQIRNNFFERIQIIRKVGSENDQKLVDFLEFKVNPLIEKNDLDLYDGKITWGQYNRERYEFQLEVDNERKRIFQK